MVWERNSFHPKSQLVGNPSRQSLDIPVLGHPSPWTSQPSRWTQPSRCNELRSHTIGTPTIYLKHVGDGHAQDVTKDHEPTAQTSLYFTRKSIVLSWIHALLYLDATLVPDEKLRLILLDCRHRLDALAYCMFKVKIYPRSVFREAGPGPSPSEGGDINGATEATSSRLLPTEDSRNHVTIAFSPCESEEHILGQYTMSRVVAWLERLLEQK